MTCGPDSRGDGPGPRGRGRGAASALCLKRVCLNGVCLLLGWAGICDPAAAQVTLELQDGTSVVASAVRHPAGEADAIAALGPSGDPLAAVPLDDLAVVRFGSALAGQEVARQRPGQQVARVELRSGLVLPAALDAERGGELAAALPFVLDEALQTGAASVRFQVPLPFVAGLRTGDLPDGDREAVERAEDEPLATEDILFARTDDGLRRLSVVVLGFAGAADGEPARLRLRFGDRERTLPLERVGALVFGTARGTAPDPLPRPTVTAESRADSFGGDGITGRLIALDQQALTLELPEGPVLRLDRRLFPVLRVRSSRVVPLSELDPSAVEQVPALDREWPWLRDEAPSGKGILLGGEAVRHGLVLRPRTEMAFDVPAGFTRFRCRIGFDDRAGPLGDAVFRVRAGDTVSFERHLRAGDPVVEVDVALVVSPDVASEHATDHADRLVLEADFGGTFDLGDHCVFADGRFTKE